MPIFTAADYRTYAGLLPADPPLDADILKALARYEALVEGYLQRGLSFARRVERYYFIDTPEIILAYWPVSTLHGVSVDGRQVDISDMILHRSKGELYHKGKLWGKEQVDIDYDGGWGVKDLPKDLRLVIMTLAEQFLSSGGAPAPGSGTIKKETVHGVATVEYFDSRDTGSSNLGGSDDYPELGPYLSILKAYRAGGWVA